MMGDKFEEQRLGRRPGQGFSGCRQAPGFKVGEIGGQRPERIVAHALVDEMAQRLDVLIGQQLGEFVAAFQWQDGGDGIELFGASLDRSL
ncbi:Uncharacterised protein [Agrobacterium tumefaciens]|nr:Uncharacterised protein [Agrobacterium tumefaciens]